MNREMSGRSARVFKKKEGFRKMKNRGIIKT